MRQTGMNMEAVKRQNRSSILKLINRCGVISRKDIAKELGLTPAAVTQICTGLVECGLLSETGTMKNDARAGRKKILLTINYDYKYVFGVSLEQEKTHLVLANIGGKVLKRQDIATERTEPEKFLKKIASSCRRMQKSLQLADEKIAGAGVCVPGIVDKEAGIATKAYGIWEEEVRVREILERELSFPVYLNNNVDAFAEAEVLWGTGRERQNLFLVKWGPGVGSSIIEEGTIYEGRHGKAGEMGHFIVKKDGEPCSCGRRGCLETMVSLPALQRRIPGLTAENLGTCLQRGNQQEKRILEEAIDLFAQTIVNTMTILAPDRVVLFGSMFQGQAVRDRLIAACRCYDASIGEGRIRYSELAGKEDYIGTIAFLSKWDAL